MATCSKRKRKVLSIEQKVEICQRLRSGASITALLKEMDIGKSMICDIKRSEDKLTSFAAKMDSRVSYREGGGLGSPPPPPPPPPRIPKVVTILLINRYIVGIATGQTILNSTVKYIKVQLDYSKIQFFSLKMSMTWWVCLKNFARAMRTQIPPILNPTSTIGSPPSPPKAKNPV